MQLSKIKIKNYRLLIDAELEVDPKTTLIVGRNNTAKTSCFECIGKVLAGTPFSFNDYPLSKRENLYANITSFMAKEITFEELYERLEPISIEFLVDYALDDPEDNLGALSPFIIDVDVDTTTALIRAEYKLKADEKGIWKILEPNYYENGSFSPADDVHNAIISNFHKLFEMTICAINPKNPEEKQSKKQKELAELFPFHIIQAERRLGEDGTQDNSLSSLISDFFDMSEDELDPSVSEKVKELRAIVENANKNVQQQSDSILSALVSNAVGFGYPNGEELQLGVTTQLSIDDQIKNQTQLSYTAGTSKERLPSTYNGLGYKNLIKIDDFDGEVIVITCDDYTGPRRTERNLKGELPAEELKNRLSNVTEKIKSESSEDDDLKVLMITHKVLATQQGYEQLLEILADGLRDKEDPFLLFFMDTVEPIYKALKDSNMQLLFDTLGMKHFPIKKKSEKAKWKELQQQLEDARTKRAIDVFELIKRTKLIPIPPKLDGWYHLYQKAPDTVYASNASIQSFLELDYLQFTAAIDFLFPDAMFSTEHGVKGEEYDNVVFVISKGWNLYQFETYAPMITGHSNVPEGKQASYERNRNLFYVCCSRPKKRLFFFVSVPIDAVFRAFLTKLVGTDNIYTYSQYLETD